MKLRQAIEDYRVRYAHMHDLTKPVSPHDLANFVEWVIAPNPAGQHILHLDYGLNGVFLQLSTGGGCWDLMLCWSNADPLAYLWYKDDAQFEASDDSPWYVEHDPVWDRGWEHLLDNAELEEETVEIAAQRW